MLQADARQRKDLKVKNASWYLGVLVALAALLFLFNISGYDLWPPDEPRFAEVAREMHVTGDYLAPHVNGEPYKEKPPLLPWAIIAASQPFGDVTELSARFPSALCGILTVLLTFLLARRLFDTRTAFWAALILMTGQRFWWQARFGQIDMLLAACLTTALYSYWRWCEARRIGWLVAFYLACTAALYAKGPGVLVFPGLLVLSYSVFGGERKALLHLIIGMSAVILLFALWLIPARMSVATAMQSTTQDAIASNLFRQTIGRFLLGVSHANWPWFYLQKTPVDWFPWVLFLPWTAYWTWRNRKEGKEMRFLLCWTVPAFLFFSIAIGKRAIYLLPLFPVFAIFFARSILELIETDHATWRKRTSHIWLILLLLIALAPAILLFTEYKDLWHPSLLLFSLLPLLCAADTFLSTRKHQGKTLHTRIAIHMTLLLLSTAGIILPFVNQFKSVRDFCTPVRTLAQADQDFPLYSVGFSREEYVFYAKRFHTPILTDLLQIDAMRDLPLREQAKHQKKLRRMLEKATEDIPIATWDAPTPQERSTLTQAAHNAFQKEALDETTYRTFEKALYDASAPITTDLTSGKPTFLFVQEEDWRWLLALHDELHQYILLDEQQVGSRYVFLITNSAGQDLLKEHPATP